VASIDSAETQQLVATEYRAAFAAPGYILYARLNDLMGQPFDPKRLKITGEPFRIAEQLETNPTDGNAGFAVSDSGHLAYRTPNPSGNYRMAWMDRSGKQLGDVGEPGGYTAPGLSPDGGKLAVAFGNPNDIWIRDLDRGTFTRFTFGANSAVPVWSPDGSRIVFFSQRGGAQDLYVKDTSGASTEELLLKSPQNKVPTDWSHDGQFIMYEARVGVSRTDLWFVPVSGDRKPQPYLQGPFDEQQGRFSPDGHWVAYTSDESGRPEIYIQSFPKAGAKYQISTDGAGDPRWNHDGKELFYISADQKLMSVAVDVRADKIQAGLPTALFPVRLSGLTDVRTHYAVSPDDRRFLFVLLNEGGTVSPITVVLNWTAGLKK
jgi:Tol biopolymer transport system component